MIYKFILLLASCLLWSHQIPTAQSAKILAVYAFPGKSHYMMHTVLIKELIRKGHEVTMIAAFSLEKHKLGKNYKEILIEPVYDFWSDVTQDLEAGSIFELSEMDFSSTMEMMRIIGIKTTEHALKQPKVQEIINATVTEGVYDLLLAEQFYQEPFLALAHKYNIPVVTTSTLGYVNYMAQMMGLIFPLSYVPHGFLPYTDRMSFMERFWNAFYNLYEDLDREWNYFPTMDGFVQQYFGHLPVSIPKVSQMQQNISVILMNSHTPLTSARPSINGLISVGGLHIEKPQPLPQDIQEFLDGAKEGAIYFSLGSNVQSKDMPPEKLQMFLKVFATLKQRILWKYEDESIKNLPKNILVKKWLPQTDILAHRNIKVFITHGGLFGTQEGVHYGIPMLGFPIYCDQHLNMKKAVDAGYAISLHFQATTDEILKNALVQLIENPSYRQNSQKISQIFRDRTVPALEEAIYWIEYVIRYKGATHIRAAGLDLRWYQFYMLDVLAAILGVLALFVWVLIRLRGILCSSKNNVNTRNAKIKTK